MLTGVQMQSKACKQVFLWWGDLKMEATNEKIKTGAIHMTSGSLWKNIFLFSVPLMLAQILEICHKAGSYWRRNGKDTNHGTLLLHQCLYGLLHCSFQRDREKCGTNGCCDPWLLCVPYCVDLHSVRTFSHDPIPVSSLFLLLVYYFCCGSPLFCLQLPRAESTFIMQAVSSCVLFCGRNRSTPPEVKW